MRYLASAVVGLALLVAGVSPAGATSGDLSFVNCVNTGDPGCTSIAPGSTSLVGAWAIAISPDGNDAYVGANASNAVSHLRRNASTGALTYLNCWGQGTTGCTDLNPVNALNGAKTPVVSPDGHSVYVASSGNTLSHFERNIASGDLSFVDCIGVGATGCSNLSPTTPLDGAAYVAITPDGKGVYTASDGAFFSAAAFTRDPGSGNLTFVNCVGQGATGCTDISPTNALNGASSIVASPDDKDLYVAARFSDAVAHLTRNTSTNALTFANCIGQGATGCASVAPTNAFDNAQGVAVSPDGANVYSTANTSDTVATLKRDPATGDLSFVSCIGQGATGCANISPTVALDGPIGVVVAPDGANAYVSGSGSKSVASLRRDPAAGSLTFQSCVGEGTAGCTNLSPISALTSPEYNTIDPSGTSVYDAEPDGNGVAAFKRLLAPVCQSVAVKVPFGKGTRVDLSCTDANGDPITLAVAANPAHGALSGIDQGTGKLTYTPAKNFSGADSFTFTASDGDTASSPATAKLTVTSAALLKLPSSARVSKGRAKLTLVCPVTVLDLCKGSVSLEASKRALATKRKKKAKPVRLGSKSYSINAGKQATVKVKLSRKALRKISKTGKLKVTAIALSTDGAGTSATQRGTVKLKGKKKKKRH